MRIDLNADLGEGFGVWRLGDDFGLLPYLSSANIACGFHAGDATTMREICNAAVEQGVRIGAQVGYRDLAGFGRRAIAMDSPELTAEVMYQIGALHAFAAASGDRVRYVKPHGALYNTSMVDPEQADAVLTAVSRSQHAVGADLPVLGLPGSAIEAAAAQHGVRFIAEAFADRGYSPSGHLVPRSHPQALITDPAVVGQRAVAIAVKQKVVAADGSTLAVHADSLCVHGDTPGAVELAGAVRSALEQAGVTVASFC